ncbi:MAG: MobF family relaxase [Acidimicrobiia bacterium]
MRIDVVVLNIGKLGPGAGEYYVGEVASSAEDYYAGRGEAEGRWVGSLAPELGLSGAVDPEHFRLLLGGRHPHTEQVLVRHGSSRRSEAGPAGESGSDLETTRAASYLGVSGQYVRRLLAEGERYRNRLAEATADEVVPEPSAHLTGTRHEGTGRLGGDSWSVPRDELDRFVASRRQSRFRPGYDLTLRPPKSVSILWALADDERRGEIRQAHREAVDEVVRYYEDRAVFGRAGGGDRRLLASDGIVAAAFDHRTSRAGDPLLHTHVVTANLTRVQTPEKGRVWRAIPGAGLFEHARAAGHLYQAHLRHLLASRLGLEFGPVVQGSAEVVGVPTELVRHFSQRRQEIEAAMAEAGTSSARAAQVATLQTRHAKDYGVEPDDLRQRWHAEAERLGVEPATIAACFGRARPEGEPELKQHELFAALAGPHGLTERSATFSRTDTIQAIASAANAVADAETIEQLADTFLGSTYVQLVDRAGSLDLPPIPESSAASSKRRSITERLYTTPEIAALEAHLLAAARLTRGRACAVDAEALNGVLCERPELSDEQRSMVETACTSSTFMLPVAGRPGAGKTFATEAIVAAHVEAGVPILGCAVSASAAAELENAAGFARSTGMPATTVARLLLDLDETGLVPGSVIVVDEASMLGTRALGRLVHHAQRGDGVVMLVGDPDQHGSVDVGGVFVRLCDAAGPGLTRLVENNRQADPGDRLAIDDYREGRVGDALARYDDAQRIVRSATAGESFDAMVADWYTQRVAEGRADPMIAGPNSTRRALNERARAVLKANGELVGASLVVSGREFMVGDDVVARRNDRTLGGTRSGFVRNGSPGRVTRLDLDAGEITVEFEREGTVRLPGRYLAAGHLDHGYARTTYGVQGATHDVGRYHPTDMSGFEEGYVAITRARRETRVYVVDGSVATASDLDHAPAEVHHHGLGEIAAALGRRTSGATVTDLAPGIERVSALAAGADLAELTRRRRHLDRILSDAPKNPAPEIASLTEKVTALRTRRRIWGEQAGQPATARRAERAVAAIDRSLDGLEVTYRRHRNQQQTHDAWTTANAATIEQRALVRRAEHSVEEQVRLHALSDPEDPTRRLLGEPPTTQSGRRVWRHAVGEAGVYRARYSASASFAHQIPEVTALGPQPSRGQGRLDWERAATTVRATLDILERTTPYQEPEL